MLPTIPLPWRLLGAVHFCVALFGAGAWTGDRWRQGRVAVAALEARENAIDLQRVQRRAADVSALQHAKRVRQLNTQLGAAHARIAQRDSRDCIDPGTVGLLNHIGGDSMRTPASEPATAAPAPAADPSHGGGLRWSTSRDIANALAECRARYAEVSSQVNAILDIDERRQLDQ